MISCPSGHQCVGPRQDWGDWSQGQKLSDGGHGVPGVGTRVPDFSGWDS